jgi:hypothetical protein
MGGWQSALGRLFAPVYQVDESVNGPGALDFLRERPAGRKGPGVATFRMGGILSIREMATVAQSWFTGQNVV